MKNFKKYKKLWIVIGALLGFSALVWAASQGMADAQAQDAGRHSSEGVEKPTMDMLKPPKAGPNCDWKKEKDLKQKIEANTKKYDSAAEKAKGETSSGGKVSSATSTEVLKLAKEYKDLQDQYSAMWNACNCKTRANLAKDLGATRVKSAEVVVSEIDKTKLDEMSAAQDKLKLSREAYVKDAKANNEIADADKADIKTNVVPRVKKQIPVLQSFVQSVTGLLGDVQKEAKGATSGGLGGLMGAAKSAGSGPKLLTSVQALLSVAKGMLSNTQGLLSDATSLM